MREPIAKAGATLATVHQQVPSEPSDRSNPWEWRGLMAAFGLASRGAAVWPVAGATDGPLPASADVLVVFVEESARVQLALEITDGLGPLWCPSPRPSSRIKYQANRANSRLPCVMPR